MYIHIVAVYEPEDISCSKKILGLQTSEMGESPFLATAREKKNWKVAQLERCVQRKIEEDNEYRFLT